MFECKVDLTKSYKLVYFMSIYICMKEQIVKSTLHILRNDANITQEELAKTVGVTRQTIIAIEKGNYVPSVLLALKIAMFFKKPVEQIFYLHYEK